MTTSKTTIAITCVSIWAGLCIGVGGDVALQRYNHRNRERTPMPEAQRCLAVDLAVEARIARQHRACVAASEDCLTQCERIEPDTLWPRVCPLECWYVWHSEVCGGTP